MPARTATADHEGRIIAEFCQHYGLTFRDPTLVKLALTHRSYLHVTGQRDSNERLEFLGDSVLGLVTSEFLYRAHPTEHEGQLTKTKSLLVSKAILSRRALAMGLGRFVLMSHSEVESGGRQRLSILADAFESVVGAVYLDQGFEASRDFIERWLLRDTRSIVADKRHTNYKSHLQEYVQSTFRTHPVYRIRSEMGPDHSKQFMVEVIVGKRTLGEGKGRNKKEAEQSAARNALERVERGPVSDRGLRGEDRESERPARAERGARERPARHDRAEGPERPERADRPSRPVVAETDDEVDSIAEESVTLAGPGSGEREVLSTRRRRGRRGGRGRRRPGEEGTEGAESAPAVREPAAREPATREPVAREPVARERAEVRAPSPPLQPRAPRTWTPPVAEPEPPAVELEPPPRAFDEDEDEEVGRPEGPREDAHVDPYAWGGQDLRAASPPVWSPSPSRAPVRDEEPSPEPDSVDDDDRHQATIDEPTAPESAPPAPPARPVYGRRSGRSRR